VRAPWGTRRRLLSLLFEAQRAVLPEETTCRGLDRLEIPAAGWTRLRMTLDEIRQIVEKGAEA
jgi:hypothetical protein